MIVSEKIRIAVTKNLTNSYIESELKKIGIIPLRWAIIETSNENYFVNVSYLK